MNTKSAVELHKDASLIDRLGGPAKVARALGFEMPQGIPRVQNWKYRGIPPLIRVTRQDVFAVDEQRDSAPAAAADPDAARIVPVEGA
ncbi:hypothetical protein ABWU93_11590 [Xanthomonas translucens pv. translucens]|uniref:hypothetical protein n=1 Tax=Xanthomonas campestris pv. translucens TaxID=343 RepID=UPI003F6EEFEA